MDGLAFLNSRRTTQFPDMTANGPTAAELEAILTAAVRVPDHGKLAPWRFIVFEGDARAKAGDAVADVFRDSHPGAPPEQIDAERRRFTRAPLVIAVVSRAAPHVKIPEYEQTLSAGAVAMVVSLAAHALGYGCKWVTEWIASDPTARARLGLSETERIAGFIYVARPAEDRPRPPLAGLVTRFG